MARPQQPELARSGRTDVDPDHAADVLEGRQSPPVSGTTGPVPPENQPGRHPSDEQDKPDLDAFASRFGGRETAERAGIPFAFAFDPMFRLAGLPFGISPGTARVEVDQHELRANFGPWRLKTPRSNIAGVEPSGPYSKLTTLGPAHVSLADRGLTFATNAKRGLCIRFLQPVPGLLPTGLLRHGALTVTVADVDGLARLLSGADSGD